MQQKGSIGFVPSRHLAQLHRKPASGEVQSGLEAIAQAYGVAQGQAEHVYVHLRDCGDEDGARSDAGLGDLDSEYEQGIVRRWLMGVVNMRWLKQARHDDGRTCENGDVDETSQAIVTEASRLIAVCAGQGASGNLRRVYHIGETDQIELIDAAVVEVSLGGRTWGSAPILAYELQSLCTKFSGIRENTSRAPLRVLELGAGTGLAGLSFASVLKRLGNPFKILLSDFHDNVLLNLRRNAAFNGWSNAAADERYQVDVTRLDWSEVAASTRRKRRGDAGGQYDCLLAADCIYEPHHADLIKNVAEHHLTADYAQRIRSHDCWDDTSGSLGSRSKLTPTSGVHGVLFLVSPLRATHAGESASIERAFPPLIRDGERKHAAASSPIAEAAARAPQNKTLPSTLPSPLRLRTTAHQTFVGQDDFGPPQLQLQTVTGSDGGGEFSSSNAIAPRVKMADYRKSLRTAPGTTAFDDQSTEDGETRYSMYTIEWCEDENELELTPALGHIAC